MNFYVRLVGFPFVLGAVTEYVLVNYTELYQYMRIQQAKRNLEEMESLDDAIDRIVKKYSPAPLGDNHGEMDESVRLKLSKMKNRWEFLKKMEREISEK